MNAYRLEGRRTRRKVGPKKIKKVKKGVIGIMKDAPKYEPERWLVPNVLASHNCYSYFLNVLNPRGMAGKPQPGLISTGYVEHIDCPTIRKAVMDDNPRAIITWGLEKVNDKCPKTYYKGFMAVNSNGEDYHFYRQDRDGSWSHKPGSTPPSKVDARGKRIFNPATASRDYSLQGGVNYDVPCSFFCVKSNPRMLKLTGNFENPGANMPWKNKPTY